MTSAQEAEAVTLRDSREARQKSVDELRERWERLSRSARDVPHTEYALADRASRDAGSADTAHRLGLQAANAADVEASMYEGNPDGVQYGKLTAHVLTLCRCLLESRRLEQ
jgi:hypothetical protein